MLSCGVKCKVDFLFFFEVTNGLLNFVGAHFLIFFTCILWVLSFGRVSISKSDPFSVRNSTLLMTRANWHRLVVVDGTASVF